MIIAGCTQKQLPIINDFSNKSELWCVGSADETSLTTINLSRGNIINYSIITSENIKMYTIEDINKDYVTYLIGSATPIINVTVSGVWDNLSFLVVFNNEAEYFEITKLENTTNITELATQYKFIWFEIVEKPHIVDNELSLHSHFTITDFKITNKYGCTLNLTGDSERGLKQWDCRNTTKPTPIVYTNQPYIIIIQHGKNEQSNR